MWAFQALELKLQRQLFAMYKILFVAWFAGLLAMTATVAHADEWSLKQVTTLPQQAKRAAAPDGLPDGEVDKRATGDIAEAWYGSPTRRYGHGILGDAIEAGTLVVKTRGGEKLTYVLPENQVFEDRTPRLHDLDGFGRTEVVTILSDVRRGGSIAVFAIVDGNIELVAQTPYIGRSNRWLNIAGIEDFDGDGKIQIAAVWTPHIGGTLKFWTWSKNKLKLSGEAYGFSNHFIGSREQELSAVADFNDDGVADIALPDASRTALRIMTFEGSARGPKKLKELAEIPLPARIDKDIAVRRRGDKVTITVGLEDGTAYAIKR